MNRGLVAMVMGVFAMCGVSRAGEPERLLRTEVVVDATPEQLWEAFTTKAGWESWAVPLAEVDFRIGGTIRTNYDKNAGVGGKGTITHHILSYEPRRMISTRFESQGSPGWAKLAEGCWVVTRFEPVSPTRTRMVETMLGWGEGPQWDDSYNHFKAGNEWSAEQLRKVFAKAGDSDADAALALMRSMVGGEWICEHTAPNGSLFRVRNVVEPAPDGKGTLTRGWLGDASGMFPHGCTQVWREDGEARFQSLDQDGGVARGTIRLQGDKTLVWDWNQTDAAGEESRYTVTQAFSGPDAYHMSLVAVQGDGEAKELVKIDLTRVQHAPAAFHKMRGGPEDAAMTIDAALFPARGAVENPLVKEVVVKASPREAFEAWATPTGLKSFLVEDCNVDLRIGGPFELFFGGPDVPPDQRGSSGCQILSYVPGEMLSFSWNAPPKFPVEREQRAWVVVTFAAAEPGRTKVRLVHTGFGEGGQWPQVREYFDSAWTQVLGAMKVHYEK